MKSYTDKRHLRALSMLVNTTGSCAKEGMLKGAEANMKDEYNKRVKKGEVVTEESIIAEITASPQFLAICVKAGIKLQDFKDMAKRVVNGKDGVQC
jgi:hypothetical protein